MLFYRRIELPAAVLHQGIQAAMDILLEVGRLAVGFQSGGILILLIDQETARVLRGLMADIEQAAGLPAGMLLELAQILPALLFRAGLHGHIDFQNDHCALAILGLDTAAAISASNSGKRMVCSRSGPVETIPIPAPVCFSIKRRYSCALAGRLPKVEMPTVERFQPGSFS